MIGKKMDNFDDISASGNKGINLPYDPGQGAAFWSAVEEIPGCPQFSSPPIKTMRFASGAITSVPAILEKIGASPKKPVLVVMDQNPMRRDEDDLKELILRLLDEAHWQAMPLRLTAEGDGQLHTDMVQAEKVKSALQPGWAVLAVGAGTICDIAKHGSYLFQQDGRGTIPLAVFQTANSVSAFTSNMAPIFINGVKRTVPSRYVDALICDLETLRDAPYDMTQAGVGDLLASFLSLPDWLLAHRLGLDDQYSRLPEQLMGPLQDNLLLIADDIHRRTLKGMEVLAKLIALSGLCMSLTEATTPMSGFEHVFSHVLDLLAEKEGRPLAMHGLQVSLAAIISAEAYRQVLNKFDPARIDFESCYPAPKEMIELIEKAFAPIDPGGGVAAECWADYSKKLLAWHEHRSEFKKFLGEWPAIRIELKKLARSPEELAVILRKIEAPISFEQLSPSVSEEQAAFAFFNASLIRRRFTIGDFLIFSHWERQTLWRQAWEKSLELAA
jgi:glycerol-1-phosphate dehydrogenase [NAD(P)+]